MGVAVSGFGDSRHGSGHQQRGMTDRIFGFPGRVFFLRLYHFDRVKSS
jgi:hypothetical protein